MGGFIPEKLLALREAAEKRQLIPWQQLADIPEFLEEGHGERIHRVYAQSWFLFHQLMQDPFRARFMGYLDRVRHLNSTDMERPRSEILEECLGVGFVDLTRLLTDEIKLASADIDPRNRTHEVGFGTFIAAICTNIQLLTLPRQSSTDSCGYVSGCRGNVRQWISAHLIHPRPKSQTSSFSNLLRSDKFHRPFWIGSCYL